MDICIYSYNNIPELWCMNSGQNWIDTENQCIKMLILKKKKEISLLFYFGLPLFVFPKAFYIYTFPSSDLMLSMVLSQPLTSEVVLNDGPINAKEFWPWILFSAFNIKCLAVKFSVTTLKFRSGWIWNRYVRKLILHVLQLYLMFYSHKNSKKNFTGAFPETEWDPASRSLSQVIPSSSSPTTLLRFSFSIKSHPKFSKMTVSEHKFTLSHGFLSTKWVPVFHSKGKKTWKNDCSREGEHSEVPLWKRVGAL